MSEQDNLEEEFEEEEQEEQQQEEEQEDLTDEQRAEMAGWDPEFDGPNKKSAKEFLEKRENDLGLANANIRQLESKIDRMGKFLTSAQKRAEEQGYKRALEEVKQRQRTAVSEGDTEAFEQAEKEEDELREEYEKVKDKDVLEDDPQERTKQEVSEVVQSYQKRYPEVFETRARAEEWVKELEYAAQRGAKSWQEAADKATRAVSKNHGLGKVPGPEDGGGKGGSSKKGFNALPREVKNDFKQFQKDNPDLDKEEYARIYFEEFGDE